MSPRLRRGTCSLVTSRGDASVWLVGRIIRLASARRVLEGDAIPFCKTLHGLARHVPGCAWINPHEAIDESEVGDIGGQAPQLRRTGAGSTIRDRASSPSLKLGVLDVTLSDSGSRATRATDYRSANETEIGINLTNDNIVCFVRVPVGNAAYRDSGRRQLCKDARLKCRTGARREYFAGVICQTKTRPSLRIQSGRLRELHSGTGI